MISVLRRTPFALACAAALVGACSKADKTGDSARASDSSAVAATSTAAMTPATPAAPTLSDANIFAMLDAANMSDSAAGSVAAAKGTASDVKKFGRDMMRDHHALRVAGQDLAKKLNVTPQPPAGDTTAAASAKWKDSLTALARGGAWDKTYIDKEVAAHQAVLNTLQTAQGAAQNADLKALIQKAAPNIQAHLEHAQQIQSKLK